MTNETRLTAQRDPINLFAGSVGDTGLFQTRSETWNGDETATAEIPIGTVVGRITSQYSKLAAATITALDVDAIAWQSGNIVRYTFASTPDLSTVVVGNFQTITGSANALNDGVFYISAFNDTNDTIDVINLTRSDAVADVVSGATGTGTVSPQINALDVDAITWQFGNVVRYTMTGTPDLSTIVAGGNQFVVSGSAGAKNDGIFEIVGVNDTNDTIDVININRIDATLDVASGATGTGAVYDEYNIGRIQAYDDAATNGLETAIGILGQEITVYDQVILNTDGTTETRAVYPVKTFTKGTFHEAELTGLDAAAIVDLGGVSSNGIFTF